MTRKVLESLLANAILQRDRAGQLLREHFDDLEKRNQVSYWMNIYLTNKEMVKWLQKQKPDDE
jgi:hypothetical protein